MTLYEQTRKLLFPHSTDSRTTRDKGDELRWLESELHSKALNYARKAAALNRDYRETYGLKILPPWVLQSTANASFLLLMDLQRNPTQVAPQSDDTPSSSRDGVRTPESTSATAFEECFRLLIGTGVHIMESRALARMIFHTAAHLRVQLPDAVMEMIRLVAETAWQRSDMHRIRSAYPNWVLKSADGQARNDHEMEDLLKRWEAMDDET
ncbi:hypothetical protein K431DRAFT_286635 [Polychaeton citri CBS 116435]|uniref:Uncharacterized protein n=1 Tax=Polychaeton citri CBS 116435 TaxID=1314669 RepID=A0A9P4Q713_9PEZI|nr:hypothetical protein K431DRAFT_286635 [Polychaeton citri CBS 116435]